jgi:predicted peroxiredoxin
MANKRLLVVLNHGTDHPSKATRAFQMAKIAKEKGAEVTLFLVDEAVYLAKAGVADTVKAPTGDELKTYRAFLQDQAVDVLVCTPCAKARGIDQDELIKGARLETGATLIDLALERSTLCF